MKKTKLAASLLAVSMFATSMLAGCDNTPTNSSSSTNNPGNSSNNSGNNGSITLPEDAAWQQTLQYAEGTTVRMACGYNSEESGFRFNAKVFDKAGAAAKEVDGVMTLTLADGKTYKAGDFKPTWQAVMDKLKFQIDDVYTGKSAKDEFADWKNANNLGSVDMVAGNADALVEAGNNGLLLNIGAYLDSMPYFKSYLERNPIVRLSITGSTTGTSAGAIYFSPYFDGVNDIERMPIMRTDWVEKLLNGDGQFTAEQSGTTKTAVYQPYMATSGSVEVDVVKADGTGVEKVTKNYDAYGNIIKKMNETSGGVMSGVDAVNMLREYIDKTYNNYYGTNRADLFIGQNAAWDADELVALLRCVCANSYTLNGTDTINGIFAREEEKAQRRNNIYHLAAQLFGIRGLEGRIEYYYVGADNKLHDARLEEATYEGLSRMHDLVEEGLISHDYQIHNKEGNAQSYYLPNDLGFMMYDYSQTQTVCNEDGKLQDGEEFRPVMVPIAKWDTDGDGTQETLMRFTDSWRSVKTDAWAISLEGVGYSSSNPPPADASQLTDKAKALLTLIDYAYSKEGQILMSYGPDAFIKTNADGSYVNFKFNGQDWPEISDANRQSLWDIAGGNYTNYARYFLGSTLSFAKSQAFEYQCTTEAGRKGAGYISTAIALGTIKHPELALNGWYTSVPTTLPLTKTESDKIGKTLDNLFDTSSKDNTNVLTDYIIIGGFQENGYKTPAEAAETCKTTLGGQNALDIRNGAWTRLVDYYKTLTTA